MSDLVPNVSREPHALIYIDPAYLINQLVNQATQFSNKPSVDIKGFFDLCNLKILTFI